MEFPRALSIIFREQDTFEPFLTQNERAVEYVPRAHTEGFGQTMDETMFFQHLREMRRPTTTGVHCAIHALSQQAHVFSKRPCHATTGIPLDSLAHVVEQSVLGQAIFMWTWPQRGSPKVTLESQFLSLRTDREQHVSDSSNHSLFLVKLFVFSCSQGNKLPDCSIRFRSFLQAQRTI